MSGPDGPSQRASAWADACLAARLVAIDPAGLGGVWLRAGAGPVRDRWLAGLEAALPADAPRVRVPLGTGDERLLGGLDLAATLRSGRPVAERGLVAAADGGIVLLPMAERCTVGTAARFAAALDTGEVAAERDGFALGQPTRFGIVALDEGIEPDERPPATLTDRLAFHLDLSALGPRDAGMGRQDLLHLTVPHAEVLGEAEPRSTRDRRASFEAGLRPAPQDEESFAKARALLPLVHAPDEIVEALSAAAFAFGIGSLRGPILAIRVARAAAALAGREVADEEDAALAARLVLAPRATRMPAPAEAPPDTPPTEPPPPPEGGSDADGDDAEPSDQQPSLDDVVLAAVAASIPADLLARIKLGEAAAKGGGAGSGAQQRDRRRGRPAGTLRGDPGRGARLNIIETIRTAAPWQALRRGPEGGGRLAIRRDDFRITRYKRRSETTTVFVVDASGSAAFHRLAEAKGAIELLLAECYIRRDRVALLAFRGAAADLLLPPTRSLARAKRSLAALPGGGGTPLAIAIDAAGALSDSVRRGGGSAVLVFLTDGRANIGRDGRPGREQAGQDAMAAARSLRATGATALFIDTSVRPNEGAAGIAAGMGARYLALPSADAASLSGIVRREVDAAGRAAR